MALREREEAYSLLEWPLPLQFKHLIFLWEKIKSKKQLKIVMTEGPYKEMIPNWQLYLQDLNL